MSGLPRGQSPLKDPKPIKYVDFRICTEQETEAMIVNARKITQIAKELAAMPRKRDLALVVRGDMKTNPMTSTKHYYVEAAMGYIVGMLRDNGTYCSNKCRNGDGRFPFCVTVTNEQTGEPYFKGACVNCRYQIAENKCELSLSGRDGNGGTGGGGGGNDDNNDDTSGGNDADDGDGDEPMGEVEEVDKSGRKIKGKGKRKQQKDLEDEEMAELGEEDGVEARGREENVKQKTAKIKPKKGPVGKKPPKSGPKTGKSGVGDTGK
ncbi:hypothetical protein HYALB_00006047 [Hymenoscyphus albidus]|uniref:Uncharacterized protein n=1 Tax=Hymenoscyphus albidus TaxID=595503 RepID=A0A9N9QC07_9HELO|nr:hypothetical protein HYALB_00006047 [Hymenoscyphus albidus]